MRQKLSNTKLLHPQIRAIQFHLLLPLLNRMLPLLVVVNSITVSCSSSASLTDIDNKLHDSSILAKQSPNGEWFLNANLVIAKGATFHIDSTDTKWLKISSKVASAGIARSTFPAYFIDVHGSLKIDSVKITSWDPATNNYAITNGSGTGSDVFIFGAPRPVIEIDTDAKAPTEITNSEIA